MGEFVPVETTGEVKTKALEGLEQEIHFGPIHSSLELSLSATSNL